jgi:predicted  nucleic acid-binding Zn-ribbon protein
VKINNIRAETNSPNNSISENKVKKISDEMGDLNQRVSDNEKLVEKTMNEITVLRAEIDNISKKL